MKECNFMGFLSKLIINGKNQLSVSKNKNLVNEIVNHTLFENHPESNDKNPIQLIGNTQDISYKNVYEERIHQLAFYDSLTSLPNEILFTNRVKDLINTNERFTVFYLDIDQFRNINNVVGRANGDQLLIQFSERIQMILPFSSMLARLSSDEFGIIITDYMDIENPEVMAKTIIDCFNTPLFIKEYELYLNLTIGISIYPSDGSSYEAILNNASSALHRAKSLGSNQYHLYSSKSNINSLKQFELERDLRKSIDNDELVLYFQPRVAVKTGRIIGAEALIRWQHPIWGLVSPGEFIPIAEESGFINNISDWVTEQVCMYMGKWKHEKLELVPISINITSNRFVRSDWKEVLTNSLKNHKVDPSLIEFEITETTLLQHGKVVESAFQYLKQLGIRIALDDFGTGYSSLSHIKDFSIDTIKLDKSFIQQIAHNENVEVIIKSIIFMAKGLHMNIVAEGVETHEQLEFLKQQECSEIQGYLFSEPVPERKFIGLLKQGFIKVQNDHSNNDHLDKRAFYRLELLFPLSSSMTLVSFQDKQVNLGKSNVLVENIGPGGLRFLSTLQLPVRPDIIYQFDTTILNHDIHVKGRIVWKSEVKVGTYQYGIEFVVTEKERDHLVKILNAFSLQLKNNAFLPDCDFINEDKFYYLRKVHATA